MTDYPEEIHADACRARDEREWEVTYTVTATVKVRVSASRHADDDELLELADKAADVMDIQDWENPELVEAEVVG